MSLSNLYLYILTQQYLLLSGEEILMSAELILYNCAKLKLWEQR